MQSSFTASVAASCKSIHRQHFVTKVVKAIQSTGIPISVKGGDWSRLYPHHTWRVFQKVIVKPGMSMEHNHLLQTVIWCPSAGAYPEWKKFGASAQEWQRFRVFGQKQRTKSTLEQPQASTTILTHPYARQLKRKYGPSMTPAAAFAGPSTELDIDLVTHSHRSQTTCYEEQRVKARADAGQVG